MKPARMGKQTETLAQHSSTEKTEIIGGKCKCGLNTIIIIIIIIIIQVSAISFRGKYLNSKDTNTTEFLETCR